MWDDWRQFWRHGWKQDAFSHGLRSLVALASVTLGGWWLDQTQAVIPLLLGVIAGALAETDDSWRGQLKAQLITLLCFAAMALAIKTSLPYPGWLMAVLGLSAFGLTRLGALGERYRAMCGAVGGRPAHAHGAPKNGRLVRGAGRVPAAQVPPAGARARH